MANGFEVNITEADFKSKESSDQTWILFQGITSLHRDGCDWGRVKYVKDRLKLWTAFGVGVSGGLGAIYIIYQMTCR